MSDKLFSLSNYLDSLKLNDELEEFVELQRRFTDGKSTV